ncbi:DNA-3-methyladenine glycosylase II [Sulfurivirga caldicuralii]|uniref:DNA-3-methyladenine glycosylase II n=1 Tax=Sulfurivirga caldicuralii TaxID=364032 RepID=A0A1N6DC67_9GAMM|nr:DNA-3-methyladenine glycosylase [Sulfurivirga caldicuralii]SIN68390.1 DNA-3-methyladenine glycosylase II [Sulfurivirga caldicuralii]
MPPNPCECNLVDAWPQALAALCAASQQLATLAARFPDSPPRAHGDALLTLMRAIAGQQISTRAADAIWARLQTAAGDDVPGFIAAANTEALRQLGLSRQKVTYLKDLVEKWRSGALQREMWGQMTDAELIRRLTEVKGIGRWTAEMFLIFHLQRCDVWPVDDIGLVRAAEAEFAQSFDRRALKGLAEPWRPWRSAATWLLWRSRSAEIVFY